mgnify:CR=1 FL=1
MSDTSAVERQCKYGLNPELRPWDRSRDALPAREQVNSAAPEGAKGEAVE